MPAAVTELGELSCFVTADLTACLIVTQVVGLLAVWQTQFPFSAAREVGSDSDKHLWEFIICWELRQRFCVVQSELPNITVEAAKVMCCC